MKVKQTVLASSFLRKTHEFRHTLEILQAWFQTTATKQVSQQSKSHKFFDFPVHIKVMLTLYCSLLNVQ